MRLRAPLRALATATAAAAVALGSAAPAQAAATRTVATWEMNEGGGARTMWDRSGHRLDGWIGSRVATGVTLGGARGYRFPPRSAGVDAQRVVRVPDDWRLDPGTRDYAVTARLRTTAAFGNVVQKGQSGGAGGFWKIEVHRGVVTCLFRGSAGSVGVGSGRTLTDGRWHTVRCERRSTGVTMSVDGRVTGSRGGATGAISNASPVSIAGKLVCDQREVGCDYFAGELDRVQIQTS